MKSFCLSFFILVIIGFTIPVNAQNPNWMAPDGSEFQFSSSMIATIKLSGVTSHHVEDRIAVFKNGELRGLGVAIDLGNGTYRHFISIFANSATDSLTIKVYHHNTDLVYEVSQILIFQTQHIQGSVDDPYVVNIYPDNNAPIDLLAIPTQQTLQGYAFPNLDLMDYLIQPDGFPVTWTYTPNPSLTVSIQGSILMVSPNPGFFGQTNLLVRATEITPPDRSHARGNRALPEEQYAEVSIIFNVVPIYSSPLWEPTIPGQGIIIGQQFDTVSLHTYENQFQGPTIIYDYKPIIEEQVPADTLPLWSVTENYTTTMSMVLKILYTPKHHFHHAGDVLVAYVGNEVRGVTTANPVNGLFYLSVGANEVSEQAIDIKFYSAVMKKILEWDSVAIYKPYDIIGDDEDPLLIDLAPIVPILSDSLFSNGICPMPLAIRNPDFTGSVTFTFIAADPVFPQYLRDEANATFCIVEDSASLVLYFQDADGDGLGNPNVDFYGCVIPTGYVTNDDDCNDNDANNEGVSIAVNENSGTVNDGFVCKQATVILNVEQNANSYNWNTGDTTQQITLSPVVTSIYTVTVSFGGSCIFTKSDTIHVEGKVINNAANDGFGTLRNILECAMNGDSISFDLPNTMTANLTTGLTIDKNIYIIGNELSHPTIALDSMALGQGILIIDTKTLNIKDVDLKNSPTGQAVIFTGPGKLDISGSTKVYSD